jgi:hypothetical protein
VRRVLKLMKGGLDLDAFVGETMRLNGFEASKLTRKYDKPPLSLREIAEETGLGLIRLGPPRGTSPIAPD